MDKEKIIRILTYPGVQMKGIDEAIAGDIVDAIPVIGDITNAIRVMRDIENKDIMDLVPQLIDLVGGAVPVIGDIFDLLTPTNTFGYLIKKLKE